VTTLLLAFVVGEKDPLPTSIGAEPHWRGSHVSRLQW